MFRLCATLPLLMALGGCYGPPGAGGQSASPDGSEGAAAGAGTPPREAAPAAGRPSAGERVYRKACYACHQGGLVGAPRLGDAAAWAPRVAQGVGTLVEHAVNGFQGESGVMPPKGGHRYLSEAEIAAAVDYMVRAAR